MDRSNAEVGPHDTAWWREVMGLVGRRLMAARPSELPWGLPWGHPLPPTSGNREGTKHRKNCKSYHLQVNDQIGSLHESHVFSYLTCLLCLFRLFCLFFLAGLFLCLSSILYLAGSLSCLLCLSCLSCLSCPS